MRTINLACLAALGACASTPEPPAPPMPSARASYIADSRVPSTAAACLTRYSYPWLDLQINCPTELVGGDPNHWVMTCPIPDGFNALMLHGHAFPQLRYEATADELGFLLHEVIDLSPGVIATVGFFPAHNASYVYNSQHQLAEVFHYDVNDAEIYHLVMGPRDADGNPLSVMLTTVATTPGGPPIPTIAQRSHAYTYDDGRLVADEGRLSDGAVYWDQTVAYDDAALRRDIVTIVDLTSALPDTGPGYNTTHQFLDAAGHLLEDHQMRAGDTVPYVAEYRYDAQGRLSTKSATFGDFAAAIDYIYTCP